MTDALIRDIVALQGPILVVGAGGFIGANLVHALSAHRDDVFAGVNSLGNWRLGSFPESRTIHCDIADPVAIEACFESVRPATILYVVAFGAYSFEQTAGRIHAVNYECLVQFLEKAEAHGVRAIVHAGSSSEYGLNCAAPSEDALLSPNSHYAVSKAAAAQAIAYFGKVRGLPVVNLRLYSVYGPFEDPSRFVPNLVRSALSGAFPPLANAEISRDYVYMDDVTAAFVRAAAALTPAIYGESINIGSGERTTMADAARVASTVFGIPGEPEFDAYPARGWDLRDWYADAGKAKRIIGWTATIGFAEGIRRTAEWQKSLDPGVGYWDRSKKKLLQSKRLCIAAVIACYKDGEAIPIMYEELKQVFNDLGVDYKIVFVNDASPDNSERAILDLSKQDPSVYGISHSRNFGSQMAFRSGMEIVDADAYVLLDGDLQDPPAIIKDFYPKWREGFDVVYGVRVKREMSALSETMYRGFYWVFNRMSDFPMPRDAGDFSLIDRKVVKVILEARERDLFLRGIRAYAGFRQTGVPYERPERRFGRSTNNLLKNIGWAKKAIFSFSSRPIHIVTGLALAMAALSLVFMVWVVVETVWSRTAPRGVPLIATLVLFFGSLNLLGIAAIGEYVGKIISEVKRRPLLIRAAILRGGVRNANLPDRIRVPRDGS